MRKATPRKILRGRKKSDLVAAVVDSEADLILTLAWRRMKFRRMFLLGLLAGAAIVGAVHAGVCP